MYKLYYDENGEHRQAIYRTKRSAVMTAKHVTEDDGYPGVRYAYVQKLRWCGDILVSTSDCPAQFVRESK
jgi:hypothetical protein